MRTPGSKEDHKNRVIKGVEMLVLFCCTEEGDERESRGLTKYSVWSELWTLMRLYPSNISAPAALLTLLPLVPCSQKWRALVLRRAHMSFTEGIGSYSCERCEWMAGGERRGEEHAMQTMLPQSLSN